MAKTANRYLEIDPWVIEEKGFHPGRSEVSESIFALANEFMGVRASFEEGFSGESVQGSYFNGIYECGEHHYATKFKGFAERWTYMVNSVDWLYTRLSLDGEALDLGQVKFSDFNRKVDMRRGVVERSFIWETPSGKRLKLVFERLLSMKHPHLGMQRIAFEALNFSGDVALVLGSDFGVTYHLRETQPWSVVKRDCESAATMAMGRVASSGHRVYCAFLLKGDQVAGAEAFTEDRVNARKLTLSLAEGKALSIERLAVLHSEKDASLDDATVWSAGLERFGKYKEMDWAQAVQEQEAYWQDVWSHVDVVIEGDDENQQGFRYCIFHLLQTYHGANPRFNVGAKGLTGEHYWGVTWWDTETYCLPFYLFNNREAARNLISYRHRTLPGAMGRAQQLQQNGARYPMCTIDGEEVCDVWQHGDLEIHVSAAVAYGVWKYVHLSGDKEFMRTQGLEILIQVARFYASRGSWGARSGKFGYWGVMGPDEMHTMVNNNAYTNFMAKKSFDWALRYLEEVKAEAPDAYQAVIEKTQLTPDEPSQWQKCSANMESMLDKETGIYEQHEGFFNLPHIEYNEIPDEQFPVLKKWPYIDLFRYDLIKQPDVLLFFFLFGSEFSDDELRANMAYYEPRCSHESSLSPAIHSILAARLGQMDKAYEYARYASRLDLDDYNNNTSEGLHVTSMSGAWMNLVYGFGGMRTDGSKLAFFPRLPAEWTAFSFQIYVTDEAILSVRVEPKQAIFELKGADELEIEVYGKPVSVTREALTVKI